MKIAKVDQAGEIPHTQGLCFLSARHYWTIVMMERGDFVMEKPGLRALLTQGVDYVFFDLHRNWLRKVEFIVVGPVFRFCILNNSEAQGRFV